VVVRDTLLLRCVGCIVLSDVLSLLAVGVVDVSLLPGRDRVLQGLCNLSYMLSPLSKDKNILVTHSSIGRLVVAVNRDLTNSAGVVFLDLIKLKCNFMRSSRVGWLLSVKMERFVGFGSLG